MNASTSTPRKRIYGSACFSLSPRGDAALSAYQSHVALARGSHRRELFETARGHWATCHGLEPDDGAYLAELGSGARTFRHIGETLAICGQSLEMVSLTMGRLLAFGFVKQHAARTSTTNRPSIETATRELEAALIGYQHARDGSSLNAAEERKLMTPTLRVAFFRVVSARTFLARLSLRVGV